MGLIQLNLPNPPAGRRADLMTDGPYNLATLSSMFTGVRSRSGQFVTPATALRASGVLTCLRILCEDLSALPLNLYLKSWIFLCCKSSFELTTDSARSPITAFGNTAAGNSKWTKGRAIRS